MEHREARMKELMKLIVRWTLPIPVRRWLQARWYSRVDCPPAGWVSFGHLRRLTPLSRVWGCDRGRPIDRYYIERFLSEHAQDIRGHVLEIADNNYTRKFGGERVTQSDVLHAVPGNPQATIVADLTCAENIPSSTFDCIICTQTVLFIYNVRAAIWTLYRILRPGGSLLVTFPGICQISRYAMDRWGDYWRFTSLSGRLLFEEFFPKANVEVRAHGNVLAATAFLYGMAVEDIRQEELDYYDPDYEVSITAKVVKPESVPYGSVALEDCAKPRARSGGVLPSILLIFAQFSAIAPCIDTLF